MNEGRFTWKPGEFTISQCIKCKHKFKHGEGCDAYPEKIPDAILRNTHDHHEPYRGDGGIVFELTEDEQSPE